MKNVFRLELKTQIYIIVLNDLKKIKFFVSFVFRVLGTIETAHFLIIDFL